MPTDNERREVARRLRELDYSDLQESLICAYLDALGIEGYADWVGIAHRLADLIEPDTTTDTTKSPELTTKFGRDPLLALAEDVDGAAEDSGGFEPLAGMLRDIAHRIREALGVADG